MSNDFEYDTEVGPHAPDLYDFAAVAEGVKGFDAVTECELAHYQEQGFLVVHDAFTPEEVRDAADGLVGLVAGQNPEFNVIQFRAEVRDRLSTMPLEERLSHVRKLGTFTEYEPRLKAMALHPRLLEVVRRLLGAEPELFQSMALLKPPRGREKPWHQDHAYFDLPPTARVVGVWIALDPADLQNGCMRVMPGWHRRGPFQHFQIRDWQMCDKETQSRLPARVAVPLPPGGCLLFDSYLPHGTPSNHSPRGRMAVQFHYNPLATPRIQPQERLAMFGGEGKGARC
jgi:phytanoyl-CoA hydroxylase